MLVGFVLIVAGLLALIYQGFSYTRSKEVLSLGSLRTEMKTTERVDIPPIVGGLVLASGVALVLLSRKSKK